MTALKVAAIVFGLACVYAAFMFPLWAAKYGWYRWWQR